MKRRRYLGWLWVCLIPVSAAAAQTASVGEPAVPPTPSEPARPAPQGLEFSAGDWKIRFYGFLRLDAHYDDSHPNTTQIITGIKAEEDEAPAAIREEKNSQDFTMHARNSRFGVDVQGPPIAQLGDAKAMAKIEIDFLANGGTEAQTLSRGLIRMRQAYAKLSWGEVSILAGQTWDVAAPLVPSISAEAVLWGVGNLGDRRPMVQGEWRPEILDGQTLIFQAAIGLTGAVDGENIDGGTTRDGEASGWPCFEARWGYRGDHPWLNKKVLEGGVWTYIARERLDTLPAGWTDDTFDAFGVGLDATLPLLDFLEFRGELWWGENLNDIRGGALQGIQYGDGGEGEVESRGYWVEMVIQPLDWYRLILGTSRDNPVNSDVTTTVALPTTGIEDNRTWYVCNRFNVGHGFSFGADWVHWVTRWRGGDFEGIDNRFSFFTQYTF